MSQNRRRRRHIPIPQDPLTNRTGPPFHRPVLPDRDARVEMVHVGSVAGAPFEVVFADGFGGWQGCEGLGDDGEEDLHGGAGRDGAEVGRTSLRRGPGGCEAEVDGVHGV